MVLCRQNQLEKQVKIVQNRKATKCSKTTLTCYKSLAIIHPRTTRRKSGLPKRLARQKGGVAVGAIRKRLHRWFTKIRVNIIFSIWPLSQKADALMKKIGNGEVMDLEQISIEDVSSLMELIDRGLIVLTDRVSRK